MLSIKKVKIHGIQDSRWTTADKVQQYKGIINLYTRDQKIVKVDNNTQVKKYETTIKNYKKSIIDNRAKLDNAIYGDKQVIRNSLAEYAEFRLAFRDLNPVMIIEHVHQNTFNKRKLLDLINYEISRKQEKLIDLKIQASILEDRLKFDIFKRLPAEMTAATITGKVQDAILKREAAIVVQHSYRAILDVMKKDHDYMFQVLEALQEDAKNQARCMFNTTTLGQLATEYLDDRRQEFKTLEAKVKIDMKIRNDDLQEMRMQVEKIDKQIKRLIRRDSDITLNINHKAFVNTLSDESLETENQLKELQNTINYLTETTLVSNYKDIFPCIQEQFRQAERLNQFTKLLQEQRDNLFIKLKHAHVMYKKLSFAKGTTRYAYEIEKANLLDKIKLEKAKQHEIMEHTRYECDVILKVRIALQRIEEMVVLVTHPKTKKPPLEFDYGPDHIHEQAKEIVDTLEFKLSALTGSGEVYLPADQEYTSFNQMQKILDNTTCSLDTSAKIADVSLIEGIQFEDPSVPNRQDVKKLSSEIVKANTKVDESMMEEPKKKKKFKPKPKK